LRGAAERERAGRTADGHRSGERADREGAQVRVGGNVGRGPAEAGERLHDVAELDLVTVAGGHRRGRARRLREPERQIEVLAADLRGGGDGCVDSGRLPAAEARVELHGRLVERVDPADAERVAPVRDRRTEGDRTALPGTGEGAFDRGVERGAA